MSNMEDVLSAARISDVYAALTGVRPRHKRGKATWRDGAGWNVSLSDKKNTWYDHAASEGGGVLELVSRVRSCDHLEALRWLSNFTGIALEGRRLSQPDRRQYMREKRLRERDLPLALLWRKGACAMAEQCLAELKGQLWDRAQLPDDPLPLIAEIQGLESALARWRRIDGWPLVEAYRAFLRGNPKLTSAMLHAVARDRERDERSMWRKYLGVHD